MTSSHDEVADKLSASGLTDHLNHRVSLRGNSYVTLTHIVRFLPLAQVHFDATFSDLEHEMLKSSLVLVQCIVCTVALAQDPQSEIARWRACADAAAARFAHSTESIPVVARLATLACAAERAQALKAVAERDGQRIADEYIDIVERRYLDQLSLNVMEMRLRKK